MRRALEALRRDRDPAAALGHVEEHRARFARGALRDDAAIVHAEALLALGRDGDARTVLESCDFSSNAGAVHEFQVIRGELRARVDCRAAIRDFDEALGRETSETLAERALRGRAACWRQLGDRAAADGDLRSYLARFPHGAYGAEARRLLRSDPPAP